jgi:hypothetical protein
MLEGSVLPVDPALSQADAEPAILCGCGSNGRANLVSPQNGAKFPTQKLATANRWGIRKAQP